MRSVFVHLNHGVTGSYVTKSRFFIAREDDKFLPSEAGTFFSQWNNGVCVRFHFSRLANRLAAIEAQRDVAYSADRDDDYRSR